MPDAQAEPTLNPAIDLIAQRRDEAITRAEQNETAYADILRQGRSAQARIDADLHLAASLQDAIDTLKSPGVPRESRRTPSTARDARKDLR